MNKGQSLFEVVVALAIVTLIVVAIVSLATNSIRNASFARNKTSATRYSQEASEWLRGQRDNDWDIFAARSAATPGIVWCLSTLSWPGSAGSCGASTYIGETLFKREAVLSYPDPADLNNIQADIRTFWVDSQGDHEVKISTYLANWNIQQ